MSKDLRVEIKLRNNKILELVEATGARSLKAFCDAEGLPYSTIQTVVSISKPPLTTKGHWRAGVRELAEALGVLPEDMFSERLMGANMKGTAVKFYLKADFDEAQAMLMPSRALGPEEQLQLTETSSELERVLKSLTPREEAVIRMRFGLGGEPGQDLETVGRSFNVTRERIRQIESKALRKLRHPSRADVLKDLL